MITCSYERQDNIAPKRLPRGGKCRKKTLLDIVLCLQVVVELLKRCYYHVNLIRNTISYNIIIYVIIKYFSQNNSSMSLLVIKREPKYIFTSIHCFIFTYSEKQTCSPLEITSQTKCQRRKRPSLAPRLEPV
jgi:hypothetical protein